MADSVYFRSDSIYSRLTNLASITQCLNQRSFGRTGDNQEINRTHITLERDADNIEDAILVIAHVQLTDRNFYNCTARNLATEHGRYEEETEGTYVRVKGKIWRFTW